MNAKSFNLFVFVLFWASFLASDEQNQVEIEALTAFKLNLHDPLGALNGWDPPMPAASCDWRAGLHVRTTGHRASPALSPTQYHKQNWYEG
ncbi:hypothetical protein SLEP1_g51151 [Rubroshorea leprosula]|uniref:Leucine-rich repeat-containing N-terminal plant-type domain-containing protein n=1 Tax=Rubroshorea leprosula TaxID=152421 RepID=A0AAV5M2D2_9ROSI|nr:hypothetical protein SLEP1_g51151 [Rubroshorea leprosula]